MIWRPDGGGPCAYGRGVTFASRGDGSAGARFDLMMCGEPASRDGANSLRMAPM